MCWEHRGGSECASLAIWRLRVATPAVRPSPGRLFRTCPIRYLGARSCARPRFSLPLNNQPDAVGGDLQDPGSYWPVNWNALTIYGTSTARRALECWDVWPTGAQFHRIENGLTGTVTEGTPSPYILGVSNTAPTGTGRSVFWSCGYHDLSLAYRNRPANDTMEWLLDGAVSGTVVQANSNLPISGALVLAASAFPLTNPKNIICATVTNPDGTYEWMGCPMPASLSPPRPTAIPVSPVDRYPSGMCIPKAATCNRIGLPIYPGCG